MKYFICKVCGHIEFNAAPDFCPVCHAPKTSFIQNDNVFVESKQKSPEAEVKHVPAITVENNKELKVQIGKTLHPMEEKHFIQFVDWYLDDIYVARVHFTARGVNPIACLQLKNESKKVTVVENCNLHGYWLAEVKL